MQIAVSPYHMTTREPAAMAALLLASRVVTILPTPEVGMSATDMRAAVSRAPRYAKFMESWAWSMPLWRSGLVCSSVDDDDASSDVQAVSRRILRDDALAPLRAFIRPGWFEGDAAAADAPERDDERDAPQPPTFLDMVAGDLLKGGPDPAISTTLAAGLDRFAARHGLMVARSEASSVAQRAEARLGRALLAFNLPMVTEAEAGRVLHIREELDEALGPLRVALADALEGLGIGEAPSKARVDAVHAAAARFTEVFDERWDEFEDDAGHDECRLRRCTATVIAMALPSDAVLRSSAAAVRALTPRLAKVGGRRDSATGKVIAEGVAAALPAVYDVTDAREVVSLIVKVVGNRSGRRR